MPDPFLQMLHDWQSYYLLVGTAAATLIGLVFIAGTFGSGMVASNTGSTIHTWVTPIIIHFGTVLFLAVLICVPTLTNTSLALFLAVVSLLGLGYVIIIARKLLPESHNAVWMWRNGLWHVFLPAVSHLFILSTSVRLLQGIEVSVDGVAVGTAILLLVGIRNAWDLTIWIAQNQREKP